MSHSPRRESALGGRPSLGSRGRIASTRSSGAGQAGSLKVGRELVACEVVRVPELRLDAEQDRATVTAEATRGLTATRSDLIVARRRWASSLIDRASPDPSLRSSRVTGQRKASKDRVLPGLAPGYAHPVTPGSSVDPGRVAQKNWPGLRHSGPRSSKILLQCLSTPFVRRHEGSPAGRWKRSTSTSARPGS